MASGADLNLTGTGVSSKKKEFDENYSTDVLILPVKVILRSNFAARKIKLLCQKQSIICSDFSARNFRFFRQNVGSCPCEIGRPTRATGTFDEN